MRTNGQLSIPFHNMPMCMNNTSDGDTCTSDSTEDTSNNQATDGFPVDGGSDDSVESFFGGSDDGLKPIFGGSVGVRFCLTVSTILE